MPAPSHCRRRIAAGRAQPPIASTPGRYQRGYAFERANRTTTRLAQNSFAGHRSDHLCRSFTASWPWLSSSGPRYIQNPRFARGPRGPKPSPRALVTRAVSRSVRRVFAEARFLSRLGTASASRASRWLAEIERAHGMTRTWRRTRSKARDPNLRARRRRGSRRVQTSKSDSIRAILFRDTFAAHCLPVFISPSRE